MLELSFKRCQEWEGIPSYAGNVTTEWGRVAKNTASCHEFLKSAHDSDKRCQNISRRPLVSECKSPDSIMHETISIQ